MIDAENAGEFEWAVEAGGLTGCDLDDLYAKLRIERKPAFKAMKELLQRGLRVGREAGAWLLLP